jgi:hypothetical protein
LKQRRKGISGHMQICAKNEQRRLARNEPDACAVRPQTETKKEGIPGHLKIVHANINKDDWREMSLAHAQ